MLCLSSLPWGPMEAYHFSSPDVKGPSLCLLEHLGGDLCPQAARAVQGPDIQVGVNSLKEGQRSVVWGARAHAVGPGCAPPRRGGLGGVEVAEPTGAWDQAQLGSPGTLPHWPILVLNPDWRHLAHSASSRPWPRGLGPQPAPPLTLKASCSSSTMLDESSCSTPSEDTGKYVCSFCRRECQAPG